MRPEPAFPLLTSPLRFRARVLLACCTVVAVGLGVLFWHQTGVDGLDRAVDDWVIRSLGRHTLLLDWLAAPPTLGPAGLTSLIMVVICLATGRLKGAILAVAAVPVASAVCDSVFKPLVDRADQAYPSGHVTSVLALTAMLTILVALPPQPLIRGRARLVIPLVMVVIDVGVAVAVIALRWHFLTDTIGGAAVGTGTVCALALLLDVPAVSRWLEPPARWLRGRCAAGATRWRGRVRRRPAATVWPAADSARRTRRRQRRSAAPVC